jgi:hypothetical protein
VLHLRQTCDILVAGRRHIARRLRGMRSAILALQWLIRVCAVVQITLGVLFWTGNAFTLLQVHMLTGIVLVLGLWAQGVLAARAGLGWAGLRWAPAAGAFVWGLLVVALGMTQDSLLPGDLHWLIKVLHLLVGVGAVGMAESLAVRSLRRIQPLTRTRYTVA